MSTWKRQYEDALQRTNGRVGKSPSDRKSRGNSFLVVNTDLNSNASHDKRRSPVAPKTPGTASSRFSPRNLSRFASSTASSRVSAKATTTTTTTPRSSNRSTQSGTAFFVPLSPSQLRRSPVVGRKTPTPESPSSAEPKGVDRPTASSASRFAAQSHYLPSPSPSKLRAAMSESSSQPATPATSKAATTPKAGSTPRTPRAPALQNSTRSNNSTGSTTFCRNRLPTPTKPARRKFTFQNVNTDKTATTPKNESATPETKPAPTPVAIMTPKTPVISSTQTTPRARTGPHPEHAIPVRQKSEESNSDSTVESSDRDAMDQILPPSDGEYSGIRNARTQGSGSSGGGSLGSRLSRDKREFRDERQRNSRLQNQEVIENDRVYPALSGSSYYSADSIIRRVEEEIAAARKAAATARSKLDESKLKPFQPKPPQETFPQHPRSRGNSRDKNSSASDNKSSFFKDAAKKKPTPIQNMDVCVPVGDENTGTSVDLDDVLTMPTLENDEEPAIGRKNSKGSTSSLERNLKSGNDQPSLELQPSIDQNFQSAVDLINQEFEDEFQADVSSQEYKNVPKVEEQSSEVKENRPTFREQLQKILRDQQRGSTELLLETSMDSAVPLVPDVVTPSSGIEAGNRARAILDTLKERREFFSSTIRSPSNPPSPKSTDSGPKRQDLQEKDAPAAPQVPILSDNIEEEKKEFEGDEMVGRDENTPKEPLDDQKAVAQTKLIIKAEPVGREVEPEKSMENVELDKKEDSLDLAGIAKKKKEEILSRKSRRIRFRDPFPVLKPANRPRDPQTIIASHALGIPDTQIQWVRPKNDLRQLLVAVMGASLQRRSNACGALKVLTLQKKNQLTLVRTDTFLEALVFAAGQEISVREKDLALDARTRALSCLRNVCEPKENRVYVLGHPGFVECLINVIKTDSGESRVLACGAITLLAKAPECREVLASTEGLLEILSEALRGAPAINEVPTQSPSDLSAVNGVISNDTSAYSKSSSYGDDEHLDDEGSIGTEGSEEESLSDYSSSTSGSERDDDSLDSARKDLPESISERKREKQAEYLSLSRSTACAALLHLSKHCAVLHLLCLNTTLMSSLVAVAKEVESPLHSKCIEILLNLTKFPANGSVMTHNEEVVDTLVATADSAIKQNRVAAIRSLQNMSADASSKTKLASESVLSSVSSFALRTEEDEKEAAVAFLYNISTEPGAVVSITNTKNVVATLVHLAHHPQSSPTVRRLSCDALATISLWLQTLAGTGKVPKGVENVPLPSQKTTGWARWD